MNGRQLAACRSTRTCRIAERARSPFVFFRCSLNTFKIGSRPQAFSMRAQRAKGVHTLVLEERPVRQVRMRFSQKCRRETTIPWDEKAQNLKEMLFPISELSCNRRKLSCKGENWILGRGNTSHGVTNSEEVQLRACRWLQGSPRPHRRANCRQEHII